MSDETTVLITVYDSFGKQLLKTAIKAKISTLTPEVISYWKEPENEKILLELLPEHCRGEIVGVEEIFDCNIIK